MKKLSLDALKMSTNQTLTNDSMKKIVGGASTWELFQQIDPTGKPIICNYQLFQEVDATGRPIIKIVKP